jgi:DNA-binding Lrp family transcriptional regulator
MVNAKKFVLEHPEWNTEQLSSALPYSESSCLKIRQGLVREGKLQSRSTKIDTAALDNVILQNPTLSAKKIATLAKVNAASCRAARARLEQAKLIKSRQYLVDLEHDKKIEAAFLENTNATYNEISKITGYPPLRVRVVYVKLVNSGKLSPTAKKIHTTKHRKKRVVITEKAKAVIIKTFRDNPGVSVATIASMVGYSFGACYRIHDEAVLAGIIKTHRKVRTSVATGPPLYIGK